MIYFSKNYQLKNYLKVGCRNLAKQKELSFISVFGLSLGIACFRLKNMN
jgi:hypothetical protein